MATLRPHFKDLWDYTCQAGIPLGIVSLGMDFYIEALLAEGRVGRHPPVLGLRRFLRRDYRLQLPASLGWFRSFQPLRCADQWGTCKCSILNSYIQKGYAVNYIGDGKSDMCPASMADHIFARSYLAELCQEKQLAYTPFETFMDVIEGLKARAGVEDS